MTKIKTALVTLLAAMLLIIICTGATLKNYASAETQPPEQAGAETLADSNGNATSAEEEFEQSFIAYLKEKYGEGYYAYYLDLYDSIIDNWGDIESCLLALGDKLPEEHQTGWDKFVGWLDEYKTIWGTALAIIAVITLAVLFKVKFKHIKIWITKLIDKLVNKRLEPIENELNLQSNATISLIHAQKALLGNNERFADTVEELTAAEMELKNE